MALDGEPEPVVELPVFTGSVDTSAKTLRFFIISSTVSFIHGFPKCATRMFVSRNSRATLSRNMGYAYSLHPSGANTLAWWNMRKMPRSAAAR